MPTRVRTGLRIPYELNTKLIFLAKKKGISKNSLMLQILWEHIETKKNRLTISSSMKPLRKIVYPKILWKHYNR